MKLLNQKEKQKIIKIIIGEAETGKSGIHKPTRTISLIETTVEEIHNKIKRMIENESD